MAGTAVLQRSSLALLGGPPAVTAHPEDLFRWPIVTEEDEAACLEVLRAGNMSGWDVTMEFEREFAAWHGVDYALAQTNGTEAIRTALWAVGVRRGDEVVAPSLTYWASAMPILGLGATVVFADVQRDTLCLDPADLERRISERTRAVVVVHYCGYPCDMEAILAITRPRGIRVVEDVSHAHGGLYHGRLLGTIGDVGAMSCMSGKAFAIGEGGMLITQDRLIHERALLWAHYERHGQITDPELARWKGVPAGGIKGRLNQLSAAVGRVQLRHYADRMAEIQRAMNEFWDRLEGVPGIRPHRPDPTTGSTMGGWYAAHGLYRPEELGNLPVSKFAEAVSAEGSQCRAGCNFPLHLHPMFTEADIYGDGAPTRLAQSSRDVMQGPGSLPVTEQIQGWCFSIPWFKHYRPDVIKQHADAYRKVAQHAAELH